MCLGPYVPLLPSQKTRNVLQYYKVQMWHARVYGPRVAAFRSRHRVRPLYGEGPRPLPCHMKGQVGLLGAQGATCTIAVG